LVGEYLKNTGEKSIIFYRFGGIREIKKIEKKGIKKKVGVFPR
jgi:hypothetical protein